MSRRHDRREWVRHYWFRGNVLRPRTYDIIRKDKYTDRWWPTEETGLDHETMINRVNQLNLAANDNPYAT